MPSYWHSSWQYFLVFSLRNSCILCHLKRLNAISVACSPALPACSCLWVTSLISTLSLQGNVQALKGTPEKNQSSESSSGQPQITRIAGGNPVSPFPFLSLVTLSNTDVTLIWSPQTLLPIVRQHEQSFYRVYRPWHTAEVEHKTKHRHEVSKPLHWSRLFSEYRTTA